MRKILGVVATAAVASILTIPAASANECMQFPNPLGFDEVEVCHENPIKLEGAR